MSQTPVIPEENNEEIKTPARRRARKQSAESAEAVSAEEKSPCAGPARAPLPKFPGKQWKRNPVGAQ